MLRAGVEWPNELWPTNDFTNSRTTNRQTTQKGKQSHPNARVLSPPMNTFDNEIPTINLLNEASDALGTRHEGDTEEEKATALHASVASSGPSIGAENQSEMSKIPKSFAKPSSSAQGKRRPDHFLSLRLAPECFDRFRSFVQSSHPDLASQLVPAESMHITLGLLSLGNDPERRALAIKTWRESADLTGSMPRFYIALQGLGHFHNRVVWARPVSNDSLDRLLKLAGWSDQATGLEIQTKLVELFYRGPPSSLCRG